MFARDSKIQRALKWFAGDDRGFLAFTALEQTGAVTHIEVSLQLFLWVLTVTAQTLGLKERYHFPRKEQISLHFLGSHGCL